MAKPLLHEQRQLWAERIQNQRASGLSVEHWCRDHGVAPHCFHYWKRRLFQEPITRNSFLEVAGQSKCSLSIVYGDVRIKIESSTPKRAFQALRELQC